MHTDDPLRVTGAGFEFIEGCFLKPVTDRARLARRIYSFCPDSVDQGIGLEQTDETHALIELYFVSNRDFFSGGIEACAFERPRDRCRTQSSASGVPTDRFSLRQRLE